MLLYSHKFEAYVNEHIIPNILLSKSDNYEIKGSYIKKAQYITDIDIVINAYPRLNRDTIYDDIIEFINRIKKNNFIFNNAKCGYNENIKINDCSNEELNKIKSNLTNLNELDKVNKIIEKYGNDKYLMCALLSKQLNHKYKWTEENIMNSEDFKTVLKNNNNIIISIVHMIDNFPLGIDVVISYTTESINDVYANYFKNAIIMAKFNKEYYFMMFFMRRFFKGEMLNELNDIIQNKFGLDKQLLVVCEMYETIFTSNNMTSKISSDIVSYIVENIETIATDEIRETIKLIGHATDNKILNYLIFEIKNYVYHNVNNKARKLYYKYYNLLPNNCKYKFAIDNKTFVNNIDNMQSRITETNGIFDPNGININPLNGKPYSDTYKEYAKKWSKFPAYEKADDIINSIDNNQITFIISGTGSGKTVLIPKFALHYTQYKGKIGITLPKRVVTLSAANYAAQTLDVELGNEIGYMYKGSPKEMVKSTNKMIYMTDGILIMKFVKDPLLSDLDIIIIDEAHERKVQIDLLMLFIKKIL
jgi:hypothetical protein